jgi:uncharacterized protein (DUF1919 family)
VKIGGVISHDLDREIQNPLVNLLRLTSVQDFQKWQNKIIARLTRNTKLDEIQHIVGKVITKKPIEECKLVYLLTIQSTQPSVPTSLQSRFPGADFLSE